MELMSLRSATNVAWLVSNRATCAGVDVVPPVYT